MRKLDIGVARDLALVAMIAFLTAGPAAQGLADIARRGTARGPAPAGRTYTNEDLKPADPVGPVGSPGASEPSPAAETEAAGGSEPPAAEPDARETGAGPAPAPPKEAETKVLQARRDAHARQFAEELNGRLQQRQQAVQDLRREFQEFQRGHAAGNPASTEAARNELQERLSRAERELASTQRAMARATAAPNQSAAPRAAAQPQQ